MYTSIQIRGASKPRNRELMIIKEFSFFDHFYFAIYRFIEKIYKDPDNKLTYTNYTIVGISTVALISPSLVVINYFIDYEISRIIQIILIICIVLFVNWLLESRYNLNKIKYFNNLKDDKKLRLNYKQIVVYILFFVALLSPWLLIFQFIEPGFDR